MRADEDETAESLEASLAKGKYDIYACENLLKRHKAITSMQTMGVQIVLMLFATRLLAGRDGFAGYGQFNELPELNA